MTRQALLDQIKKWDPEQRVRTPGHLALKELSVSELQGHFKEVAARYVVA